MRYVVAGALIVMCGFVLGFPQGGGAAMMDPAAGIKAELKTAFFHSSELAQRGTATAAVQLHAQHTINCLEGPAGMHFKAAAGFPCQGQGNGIIPDLRAAVAHGVPGAKEALADATTAWTLAMQAVTMTNVNESQPWMKVVAKYLSKASADLGG